MSRISQNQKANLEANPIGRELQVEVAIPEKFEIKMVDATTLADYELWGVITSVMCNFLVGFAVAAISNTNETLCGLLWGATIIFVSFVIFSLYMSYRKREQMTIKKKTISMGVTKQI